MNCYAVKYHVYVSGRICKTNRSPGSQQYHHVMESSRRKPHKTSYWNDDVRILVLRRYKLLF